MSDGTGMTPPAPAPVSTGGPASDNSKAIAAFGGYLFAPWGLIALFLDPFKNEPWLRKHVLQGAAFAIIGYLIASVTSAFLIGLLVYPIIFIILVVYTIKAWKSEDFDIPVITGLIKNWINPS
jgi:uncharacterized membrane protein